MKRVIKKVLSHWENEGVGAKVRRSIGRPELKNLDPFLLLDELRGLPPAGFPDHPHRGFETVSYLLSGCLKHEDFMGNTGVLKPGDVQWMTAGKGVVHSEMLYGDEVTHGLQLWVNLSKKDKMVDPSYQELPSTKIPTASRDGVTVHVIAGEALGAKSPIYTRTPTTYVDVCMEPSSTFTQPMNQGWTSFIYVLEGQACIGDDVVDAHHTCVLSEEEEQLVVRNKSNAQCHFVLISGKPINEPIVQRGPFVMNTTDEINQAFSDYRSAANGFENVHTWRSK